MRVDVFESGRRVVIDPHDGTCNGQHSIAVVGLPLPDDIKGTVDEGRAFVTLTWGPSAMLSIRGSEEFREAFDYALAVAREMHEKGHYLLKAPPPA